MSIFRGMYSLTNVSSGKESLSIPESFDVGFSVSSLFALKGEPFAGDFYPLVGFLEKSVSGDLTRAPETQKSRNSCPFSIISRS